MFIRGRERHLKGGLHRGNLQQITRYRVHKCMQVSARCDARGYSFFQIQKSY